MKVFFCFLCVLYCALYDTVTVVEPGTLPDNSEPPSYYTHTTSPSGHSHTDSSSDSSNCATITIEGNLSSKESLHDSKITAALSVAVVSLVVAVASLIVAGGAIICVSSRRKYSGYKK